APHHDAASIKNRYCLKSKIETLYFRLLIAYQWTQRHFQLFGNLSTNHGRTVMVGLENAVKNNIKQTYLRVDPDNFRVLSEIVAFCVASKFGPQVFAPDVQMTWQTFLAVVVSALGKQYH
uniref:Globin domain-containing protein n=1 Tax=Haplochromis burtoni TaxID=8153 RepID=A0A3Q2WML5_HAPBU